MYRDPFDLSIDIFATQILDRDVNTQEIRSVDTNSIVYGGLQNPQLYQPASVEYDPTDGTVNTIITETMADHFFTGMVIDHRCHMYVYILLLYHFFYLNLLIIYYNCLLHL